MLNTVLYLQRLGDTNYAGAINGGDSHRKGKKTPGYYWTYLTTFDHKAYEVIGGDYLVSKNYQTSIADATALLYAKDFWFTNR